MYSVKKVAKMLDVSIQTLRNWDKSGYLKASKTEGGHRRYSADDIGSFIRGNKSCATYSCYEIDHQSHLDKIFAEEGANDSRAMPCGGFTKQQIGMLLKNQDTAHDEATKALPPDLFFKIAKAFSAPYLFDTRVMPLYSYILYYKRHRNDKIVCESEEVVSQSHISHETGWLLPPREECFLQIVKDIDQDCVNDVMNNAKHLMVSDKKDIVKSVEQAVKLIDESTETREPKIILLPPEIILIGGDLVKLNDNLKLLNITNNPTQTTTYISRLVPENKILVGTKSQDRFSGYYFCPYMLMCEDGVRNRVMIRSSKKLLREGSKHYALITVK